VTGPAKGLPRAREKAELADMLKHTSPFEGLDEAHLRELVSLSRKRSLGKNESLFLEGDAAGGLYVMIRGRVKVFKSSSRGREQTLMIMGAGEPVGEVAVLSGVPYPASAETLEESEVLYVPRQAFLDMVAREPEVAMRLLAALSERLRSFATLIEDLSLREVGERLATYLLSLATQGQANEVVELELSRTQLSAAVGTVPETLSRAFRQLDRVGAVETRGRKIVIRDREALERMADGR